MKKRYVFITLVFLFAVAYGISSMGDTETTTGKVSGKKSVSDLITKSPDEMLPARSDIPTEFKTDKETDVTEILNVRDGSVISGLGFDSGKKLTVYKIGDIMGQFVTDAVEIRFYVYKFSSVEGAEAYYTNIVDYVKELGGYKEMTVPVSPGTSCFTYIEDYGFTAKAGESICNRKNVVFKTSISATNTWDGIDSYFRDMARPFESRIVG